MRWLFFSIVCLLGSSSFFFFYYYYYYSPALLRCAAADHTPLTLARLAAHLPSALIIAVQSPIWSFPGRFLSSQPSSSHPLSSVGWKPPRPGGGSMLALAGQGLFEPINLIVSGQSDAFILTEEGFLDYARSIGFSFECLRQHRGGYQQANLGDGKGWENELFELREVLLGADPGDWIGTCVESFTGGNHFRAWQQNGSAADTGAWFLAVSKEKSLRFSHTIDENGYNVGRDLMVAAALQPSCWNGRCWQAMVEWSDDLLAPGSDGINHGISQDGKVAILFVEETFDTRHGTAEDSTSALAAQTQWEREGTK